MSKRTAFDFKKKKEVIEWIHNEGGDVPTRAAKKFNIAPGTVRTWWSNRDAILDVMTSDAKRRRMTGGGRHALLGSFECEIAEIIVSLREDKQRVTRETVRELALVIAKREGISDAEFTASDGWMSAFLHRHRFSFRRVTNLCSLSDDQLLNRAFEYMKFLQNKRKNTLPANTILLDETAVYLEDPRCTTIDRMHHN